MGLGVSWRSELDGSLPLADVVGVLVVAAGDRWLGLVRVIAFGTVGARTDPRLRKRWPVGAELQPVMWEGLSDCLVGSCASFSFLPSPLCASVSVYIGS